MFIFHFDIILSLWPSSLLVSLQTLFSSCVYLFHKVLFGTMVFKLFHYFCKSCLLLTHHNFHGILHLPLKLLSLPLLKSRLIFFSSSSLFILMVFLIMQHCCTHLSEFPQSTHLPAFPQPSGWVKCSPATTSDWAAIGLSSPKPFTLDTSCGEQNCFKINCLLEIITRFKVLYSRQKLHIQAYWRGGNNCPVSTQTWMSCRVARNVQGREFQNNIFSTYSHLQDKW